jgi:hypothetical protein
MTMAESITTTKKVRERHPDSSKAEEGTIKLPYKVASCLSMTMAESITTTNKVRQRHCEQSVAISLRKKRLLRSSQ